MMNASKIFIALILLSILLFQCKSEGGGVLLKKNGIKVQNETVSNNSLQPSDPCSIINPLGYYVPMNTIYHFHKFELDNIFMDDTVSTAYLYWVDTITNKRKMILGKINNLEYPSMQLSFQLNNSEINIKSKFYTQLTPYCTNDFKQGKDTALVGIINYLDKIDTLYFTWLLGD